MEFVYYKHLPKQLDRFQVFKEIELFFTPHIQPGPKDMKIIIECGGGSTITEEEALSRIRADKKNSFCVVSQLLLSSLESVWRNPRTVSQYFSSQICANQCIKSQIVMEIQHS